MRGWGAGCVTMMCALMAPAAAHAATLVNSDGLLSYTAAPGEDNYLSISGTDAALNVLPSGPVTVEGCTPGTEGQYTCAAVRAVTVKLGDGDDGLSHYSPVVVPVTVDGGPGDDGFRVQARDVVQGGSGIDIVHVHDDEPAIVDLSLGTPFAAVEDVALWRLTGSTLVGDAAGNRLQGTAGPDVIVGGAGSDELIGGVGDDTLNARDGEPDRVNCSTGNDVAIVDQFDQVSDWCEAVQRTVEFTPAEDAAPSIAWAGAATRSTRAGVRATMQVTAADDRGAVSVRFFDDDRVVCSDTTAPYACGYTPGTDDIGRSTLVAVVTDGAGQTATAAKAITVKRFAPNGLTLTVRNGVASGKLRLPSGAPCAGTVTVRGKRTALGRDCTYRTTIRVADGARVRATFNGTEAVEAKRSATRRAR